MCPLPTENLSSLEPSQVLHLIKEIGQNGVLRDNHQQHLTRQHNKSTRSQCGISPLIIHLRAAARSWQGMSYNHGDACLASPRIHEEVYDNDLRFFSQGMFYLMTNPLVHNIIILLIKILTTTIRSTTLKEDKQKVNIHEIDFVFEFRIYLLSLL